MNETQTRHLEVADRCDRCGAQAFLKATMPSGTDLLFCAHHGTSIVNALIGAGAKIADDRSLVPA